jgi:hypothetical protein
MRQLLTKKTQTIQLAKKRQCPIDSNMMWNLLSSKSNAKLIDDQWIYKLPAPLVIPITN